MKDNKTQLLCLAGQNEKTLSVYICLPDGTTLQISRFEEDWFPTKKITGYDLREELYFEERYARTDRLYMGAAAYQLGNTSSRTITEVK